MKLTLKQAKKLMAESGGGLYLSGSKITSLPDNLTVGGELDLSGSKITSLPDNLTVGGGLDLRNTEITSLPDNLTVGGWLDLSGSKITSLPDNLTVGGELDLSGSKITSYQRRKVKRLKNGDYVPHKYLYADNILTHIKSCRTVGEYKLYNGKIPHNNVVSNKEGTVFAHCDDMREGIADILFKTAAERGAEQYKNLTLDSVVTKDEAIMMYRIITGACRQGTENFVNSLGELKEQYAIKEILEITEGQYGHDKIKSFFEG